MDDALYQRHLLLLSLLLLGGGGGCGAGAATAAAQLPAPHDTHQKRTSFM
jgi:hypothetical protein